MERCKNCRFWVEKAFNENGQRDRAEWRLCDAEGKLSVGVYGGAEGIATAPDFGCVLFEAP